MKSAQTLSFVALLTIAGVTSAQEATPDANEPFQSTTTRAEVVAEALQAQRHGLLAAGERQMPFTERELTSTKTRAEVVAEMLEARRLGLIAYGEGDTPIAIPEQAQLISDAGHRSAAQQSLVAR